MALAHTTKTIGGTLFSFGKLPAAKARPIVLAMANVVAAALAHGNAGLMEAMGKVGDERSAEDDRALLDALLGALQSLASDDWTTPDGRRMLGLDSLMDRMFEHVRAKGPTGEGPVTVDFFDGRIMDMYKVLAEALRFNFADFLGASLSRSSHGEAPTA